MRRKRLLSLCAALLVLLAVPVRALESPGAPELPEAWEDPAIDPAPPAEDPEAPDVPENPELPENPDVPESPVQPENPETAEIPDETGPAEELEQPSQDEQVPVEAAEAPLPDEFPIINVSVPGNSRAIVNPYRLEVKLEGETHTEQIVGETCAMTNLSECPVAVSVSAAGTVYGQEDMRFVARPPAEETYWKELFLYVEFLNEQAGGAWSRQYTGAVNQILVAAEPYERLNVLELSPGEMGFYRMFGAVTTYPENPWSKEDGFLVTLTFTFTPLRAESEGFPELLEAWDVPELPESWETPAGPEFPEDPAGPDETEWEDVLY